MAYIPSSIRRWITAFLASSPSMTGNVDIQQSATLKARLVVDTNGNLKIQLTEKAPGAASCALAGAGAGNVDNGVHRYKVTFVTAGGETEAGTASSGVTVADKTADGKVALSSIPTGSAFVTARKIYRTVAGGSVYKLLATISDNTTTTYTDNTADASLTTTAPTTNSAIDTRVLLSNSGAVTMAHLPTSDPVAAGQLWNNAGAVKISAG